MWPLIAFILLGIVVAALIEINERHKAKRSNDQCPTTSCSSCDLHQVCDKGECERY